MMHSFFIGECGHPFLQVKLADKQAALEKLQWEAMTSNRKVELLQEDLDSMRGEISSFMLLVEGLAKNPSTMSAEDYDVAPYYSSHLHQEVSSSPPSLHSLIFLFLWIKITVIATHQLKGITAQTHIYCVIVCFCIYLNLLVLTFFFFDIL